MTDEPISIVAQSVKVAGAVHGPAAVVLLIEGVSQEECSIILQEPQARNLVEQITKIIDPK